MNELIVTDVRRADAGAGGSSRRHDRRCLCSDCKRDARQERGRGEIEPSEWLAADV